MSSHPETSGFNHVATMTADLDRYLEFYGDVFGAEVNSIMEAHDDHPRMAVVNMGGGGALNVFEVPADSIVGDRTTMGGAVQSTTTPWRWNQRRSSSRSEIVWWRGERLPER